MNVILCIVALCSILSVSCFPQIGKRPPYIGCVESADCASDSCCRLGMMRYSAPYCDKKKHLNETCALNYDEPKNLTLTYPNGDRVSVVDIYWLMCPCVDGLICDPRSGRCEDFDNNESPNGIQEGNHIED